MSTTFRLNFEIQKMPLWFNVEVVHAVYEKQDGMLGFKAIRNGLFPQEGLDYMAAYFPIDELRKTAETVVRFFQEKPEHIEKVHEEVRRGHQDLFELAKTVDQQDITPLSDAELKETIGRIYHTLLDAHGLAIPSTWFVDSDGEDLTNFLFAIVKKRVEAHGGKNASHIFSVLTTPAQESFQMQEEKDSLHVLENILQNNNAKHLFLQKSITEKDVNTLDATLREVIFAHHQKWHWMPYTYIGPDYPLSYFLEQWAAMVREGVNPQEELKRRATGVDEILSERNRYLQTLGFTDHEKRMLNIAANIVWLKGFRKDALYYASLAYDKLIKELGKRHALSLNQMRFVTPYEIDTIETVDVHDINKRLKYCLVELHDGNIRIHTGDEAKTYFKSMPIEKVDLSDISELKGSCACVGKVTGRVKIINIPEEMGKMEQGDIMVAHTTFPALVPAMKKASAIVTDDGGLTCHAAIVSRELAIPCVIGTKIATRVLKDGDTVEVDANNGIVRKIS